MNAAKFNLVLFTLITVVLVFFSSFGPSVNAEENAYSVDSVHHSIEVLYNGYIVINDTIQISGNVPDSFLLGFPYHFGEHVLRCEAYNEFSQFPVTLNVPLDDRVGFYAVEVTFPQGAPNTFSVVFVLSNELYTQNPSDTNTYILTFPEYPTLTKPITNCNVSIIVPADAVFIEGTVDSFNYVATDLSAFTYSPGILTFFLESQRIKIFEISQLTEIFIEDSNSIQLSEEYTILNQALSNLPSFELVLPFNATDIVAHDNFGRRLPTPSNIDPFDNRYRIYFPFPLESSDSLSFTLIYYLPVEEYLVQETSGDYSLSIPFLQRINYFFKEWTTTIVLPEGAKFISPISSFKVSELSQDVFRESITLNRENLFAFDSFEVSVFYEFLFLWSSFRPTLWIGILSIIGCVAVVILKQTKNERTDKSSQLEFMEISSDKMKVFSALYEEKNALLSRLASLEHKVQKRKISRRRYKVQKKIFQNQSDVLSEKMETLKTDIRRGRGLFSELITQLEHMETKVAEIDANIQRNKIRYNEGALSLDQYNKLYNDYAQQKENAEATIEGILLRMSG